MDSKIRVGVIGAGGIARNNQIPAFQAASELCEVVSVCDINTEACDAVGNQFSIAGRYADYSEMLAKEFLDAVVVTTPNRFHLEPTLAALEAGAHVLCEKPLAMNAVEASQMVALAEKKGLLLQVGLQLRFTAAATFLKQYIDNGEMGDIYYARAQALRKRGVPNWGVFIDKEKQGGGPLIDLGVHILDLTLHFMGYPKPVSASGQTWNHLGTNSELFNGFGPYDRSKFTIEDMAVGFIRFENGAVVSLESSFMANTKANPYDTQLLGTKSGAALSVNSEPALTITTERRQQMFDMTPANLPSLPVAHFQAARAFLTSIKEGKPSLIPGRQGLVLNAILDAVYRSAESGREEAISV